MPTQATHGSIYGLFDPITGELRYIGKTTKSLLWRLGMHRRDKARSHKTHWIQSLVAKGMEPAIVEIERVPVAQLNDAECRSIAHHRALGSDLTNQRDGGDGGGLSAEARRKIGEKNRISLLGNKNGVGWVPTEEQRAKMRARPVRRLTADEHRKLLAARGGNSEETRAKISASRKEWFARQRGDHNSTL